jgi:glycosyltransferase involved in cell wall biosynthesis
MRVCLICNEYPPLPVGGQGARVSDLAPGLVTAGDEVTVVGVVPTCRGITSDVDEVLDGVRGVRLSPPPDWVGWRIGRLWERYKLSSWIKRAHRQRPFDLVEAPEGRGWMLFGGPRAVPLLLRFEASQTLYDHLLKREGNAFLHRLERKAMQRGDFFSALSQYAADETIKLFQLGEAPCRVLYNAVATDRFAPAVGGDGLERGLVVFVNGIEERKGVRELLLSFNIWGRSHPFTRLVLIGSDTGPVENGLSYSDTCLSQVDVDLRDRVVFKGRLERMTGVISYLQRAHLCCYPSHIETFGVAPVEAMSVGKPVVYSRTGPGPEVIEDGVSGLLCDPFDPEDIASKIQSILDNESFARDLGKNGRRRVLAMFDKSDWIERNRAYYADCLEHFPRRR